MKHRIGWVLAIALLAGLIPVGSAFAKEITQITVSGPGLDGVMSVTDEATFQALMDITDWGRIVNMNSFQPPQADEPYFEVRLGFGDENGAVFAWNVYHYYPDSTGETAGYVYFAEVVGGASSEESRWFYANRAGADAVAALVRNPDLAVSLAEVGPVRVSDAAALREDYDIQPASAPAASSEAASVSRAHQPNYTALGLGLPGGLALTIGAVWVARKRKARARRDNDKKL